ncbi:UPF0496 protein At5g66675-like [Elaeis guineensis]|uniref:UPF0496 protein At5g66675-like n=1 Tax=Elaeis guineensis var. tenera TaxID=51953 RepID=UPI003C6D3BE9
MGCRFSKTPVVGSSSNIDVRARHEETYRLLAELRSIDIASWPPPAHSSLVGTPELKEATSKNPALLSFINDHIDHTINTLRSLNGVKGHLDKAQVILSTIRRALECFEKDNAKGNDKKKKKKSAKKYSKVIDKLIKESRAVGNPFVGLNTDKLRSACERLRALLAALHRGDQVLEKRRTSVKKCKKAWHIIYMAGTVAVLACSVILAAVAAPAAAIAGITASATAMNAVEPWINSLWDGREGSLQDRKDIIAAMQRKSGLLVRELETVCSIIENLKIDMDVVLKVVDSAISGEEDGEKIGIENIMAKTGELGLRIDSLNEKLDLLGGGIRKETAELLEIILKTPRFQSNCVFCTT